MKTDLFESTNGPSNDGSVKRPVQPRESGKGLPYAPVDWPKPGDIWTWKVANGISPSGYYIHRFLIVPPRLQKSPTRKIWLGSKPSVTRYLRSNFPDADIEAFFASFTWKIPAEVTCLKKVKSEPRSKKAMSKADSGSQIFRRTRKSTLKCVQHKPNDITTSIDLSGLSPERVTLDTTVDENDLAIDHPPEDFESYLNSLDDILSLPVSTTPDPGPPLLQMEYFTQARMELSSLLSMDFNTLVASKKLPEVTSLSSKLRPDPYLSLVELSMLNLIEEMPLASVRFLDAKQVTEESCKFFVELDGNVALINTLKSKYMSLKDKIAHLKGEHESASSTIQEIDEHIGKLQSLRVALVEVVERRRLEIDELVSTQKRVSSSIPKIVNEVQVAKLERSEWEMKQKKAAKEEAEIIAKFAPLEGFSFMH